MFSLLLIVIPLLSHYQVLSTPVLLWSHKNLPNTAVPLSKLLPTDIIKNYICQIDAKQIEIRLFAVQGLTNKDIRQAIQSKQQILLDAKNDGSQYRYFPNVDDDTFKAFLSLPEWQSEQCSHIHFQLTSSNDYKSLDDALNDMEKSIENVKKDSNTATITAIMSNLNEPEPVIRKRRDLMVTVDDVLVSEDDSCMFYADELYLTDDEGKQSSPGNFTLDLDKSSCKTNIFVTPNGNISSAILELFWNNGTSDIGPMILMANLTGLYWRLEKAMLNDVEYRYFAYGMYSLMDTPPTYSYVCTTAIFVKYNSTTKYGSYDFKEKFFLTNLQFQPFNGNGSYFGPSNYCTSFFTSGIWMGLTSSLLCFGILLFGVYRMMSIKSNDRYDDPKGKPLIIKAQE